MTSHSYKEFIININFLYSPSIIRVYLELICFMKSADQKSLDFSL